MYWTHLIFVLLYGVLISWDKITASKPGYLDFDNLPETNFSCDGKVIGGYYADVETGCQMFHVCTIGQKGEVTDIKFLCLNGTVFDQETRVCERIDEVDCAKSEHFFGLNLELYGNNANFGIQPENEFDCEDCSTDQTDDDEYEESEETTTFTSSTTSTTTTTTTAKPTTTTTTSPRPPQYQTSSQETIAALLALHNAFNQGLQASKVKAPPPRVINNAFSPTKPTIKTTFTTYTTQRPNLNLNFKSHYTPDSQSYGSLNLQQRERPYYFTPATEKSNYHHFHSGDTSFGHSFDATRPYNFQYFHSRKIPEDKSSVSVVTSTSTSTSVKTSKSNTTEYPTGYEDYQDDIQDSFFHDVPKLRQKRELHSNHKYDEQEETTTVKHKNHKYEDELNSSLPDTNDRDEFLQNLLGSIDLEDHVRKKMADFFKKEEVEMDKMNTKGGSVTDLGNKIGQIFLPELNTTDSDGLKTRADKLLEWSKHFDDMKKDINLNYTFELNFTASDNKLDREKRDTGRELADPSDVPQPRRQTRRKNIDTEQFPVEGTRRKSVRTRLVSKPVSEAIQDDYTTVEYRRSSKTGRSQPRSTTSIRAFTFNYETTSAIPESDDKQTRISNFKPTPSKDIVHEEIEQQSGEVFKTSKDSERNQFKPAAFDSRSTDFVEETIRNRPTSSRIRTKDILARDSLSNVKSSKEQAIFAQEEVSRPVPSRQTNKHHERAPIRTSRPSLRTSDIVLEPEVKSTRTPLREDRKSTHSNVEDSVPLHQTRITRLRGSHRARTESPTTSTTTIMPRPALIPDPGFSCEGKVKGGFYADMYNDCRAFFICSQGMIDGPLLQTHFACGDKTKFNQRSRTCQAEDLVECEISERYFHLNNDFLVPVSEDELRGSFEPLKVR